MTRNEFSDAFTTLLNSYNTQAKFGEQASGQEIVLDEYEKSVLLTQAQDIVVKSYFDRTLNTQGQGFDDTPRRQVDFSSLIKIAEQAPISEATTTFDSRGIVFQMPKTGDARNTTDVLFILNEKLVLPTGPESPAFWHYNGTQDPNYFYPDQEGSHSYIPKYYDGEENEYTYDSVELAEESGWAWTEAVVSPKKEYVIVPISYTEYDREMSKPFAQPLKKQVWRLFQNQATGFDVNSEIIPKETLGIIKDTSGLKYKIRYVRRPKPIILEKMPDGLTIDGMDTASDCELNPVLHIDILNKAVELAIATRGYNARNVQQTAERA